MSAAMDDCEIPWHTNDDGVVLTHLAIAIADGADCLADIGAISTARRSPGAPKGVIQERVRVPPARCVGSI
jgi:hypothetical protein